MIDDGASMNLIDEATYRSRNIDQHGKQQLAKANCHIYFYGSSVPVPVLGTFVNTIRKPHASTTSKLPVFKGNIINIYILRFVTAKQLNLLHVSVNIIAHKKQYRCLFGGIGKAKV